MDALSRGLSPPVLPDAWLAAGAAPAADPGADPTVVVVPVTGRPYGTPGWLYLVEGDVSARLRRRLRAELPPLEGAVRAAMAEPAGTAVLPWLDHGESATQRPYLVGPRPGPRLADDLARGPLIPAQAVGAVLACADALRALHRHGRPHGQVSPAALHHDGSAIRLAAPLPPALAEIVAVTGGSGHEPPEVLRGGENTVAADVFSLASTAWTLLAGRPPYGSGADKLARLTASQPPRLQRTDLPDGVESALRAALDPDPARRPDLDTLAAALRIVADSARTVADADGAAPVVANGTAAPLAASDRQETLAPTRPVQETGRPLGSRYVLDALIGRGTTGHVWRGHVRGSSAQIAVKLLRSEFADDPEVVTRFMRERSALMRLAHPNLVAVRDLVAEGGALAIVMELVDGPDLRAVLARGPLPPAEAASLLAQTAAALAAVHAAGIVHRDLKPENILVERGGVTPRARLTDFGLARAVESSVLTRASQLVGTPAYVAPEVVAGRPPGPAADVYAFGVTAYETLSGRRPFAAESTAAVLRAHLDEQAARPDGMADDVWELLAACLRKDPQQRPSTDALAAAWAGVAEGRPASLQVPAPSGGVSPSPLGSETSGSETGIQPTTAAQRPLPPAPTGPAHAPHGRRRMWLLLAAAVLVVGFGVGFGVAALRGGSKPRTPDVTTGYPLAARIGTAGGQPLVSWTVPAGVATSRSVIVVSRVGRDGTPGAILPPTLGADRTSVVESDLVPGDCVVVYMYATAKAPPPHATAAPACVPGSPRKASASTPAGRSTSR